MAIHNEQQTEIAGGFNKVIDRGAMSLMLDILQKFQYQYPIKSAVRELASNGVDSIRERDMALSILTGQSKIEDHYLNREGEVYQDSHFKPEYYDIQWLGDTTNVEIIYTEGNGTSKDSVTIRDNGVGLGGMRLQKYFSLGFSTKRLNKKAIGKFGIGNKSPLAIGPYYTVESRYNGMLYRFNVYAADIESIIPAFDLETEQPNGCVMWKKEDGTEYPVYYQKTEQPNGVAVTIEAKKHHRQQYIDAVKSQLLYFDNVKMVVHHEDGNIENVAYKANILYEDDLIVLSDNSYWAKPHMLINKVNYGFINFEELELENKTGNIGIKVDDTEVTLNPSREGVIWDEQTKSTVLKRFQDAVKVATILVQEELKDTDFVNWLRICFQISSRYSSGGTSVINRLAQIIDISTVEPSYPGDNTIKFKGSSTVEGMDIRFVHITSTKENGKTIRKLVREDVGYKMATHVHLPMVLQDSRSLPRKDKYILKHVHKDGFLRVSPPFWLAGDYEELTPHEFEKRLMNYLGSTNTESAMIWYIKNKDRVKAMWYAFDTSESISTYHNIEVPDDFVASDLDADEEDDIEVTAEEKKEARLTNEERRKAQGKTIMHVVRAIKDPKNAGEQPKQLFDFTSVELPIASINDWKEPEIYYGSDIDRDLLVFANLFCIKDEWPSNFVSLFYRNTYTRDDIKFATTYGFQKMGELDQFAWSMGVNRYDLYSAHSFFDSPEIRIVKVAQSNTKMYRDFKHINRFFFDVQNNVVTMSNKLIQWNTARKLSIDLPKLLFLYNYPNQEKRDGFRKLYQYFKAHYKGIANLASGNYQNITAEAYDSLLKHTETVETFQFFVKECDDPIKIAEMAKELWGSDKITDAAAIDMQIWNEFQELLEWSIPIRDMLNTMPILTGRYENDPDDVLDITNVDLEDIENHISMQDDKFFQELDSYLHWKGVL
jgi:Histidine kinase-, DNA gyrase B-, and HSP90-like ATPase